MEIDVEPVPQCQGVVDGLAQEALGQNLGALAQRDQVGLENPEHRCGLFLAQAESFGGVGAVRAQGGFNLVEPLDGSQHPGGEGLARFECVMELAPCVRPAGKPRNIGFAIGPGVVASVGIGLQEPLVIAQQVVKTGGLATGVPLIEDIALDAVARGVNHPEETGGTFALAGVEIADGGFVRLKVAALKQAVVDEFVDWLDRVGDHLVPVAEGVPGNVQAVADIENARGTVVGPVVAVFGFHHVGHQARRGAKPQGRRRGRLDGHCVELVDGNMHDAHGAIDENDGRLEIEAVGEDALQFSESRRVELDVIVDEHRLAHFEMGKIAGLARGTLFGRSRFSRRSGVCGRGGFGFFCGVGIQQQLELGRVERFAFAAVELAEDLVDALAQELVLDAQAGDFAMQGRDLIPARGGTFGW